MKNDVVRAFGHPLHASMVHIPLGLMASTPIWDIVGMATGNLTWWQIGFWTSLVGVVIALPVAVVGLMDMLRATSGPSRSTAVAHMIWNLTAVAFFTIALIVRGSSIILPPREVPVLLLDLVAFVALGIAGWLGGQLVFHHGIGRTSGAVAAAPAVRVPDRHERAA